MKKLVIKKQTSKEKPGYYITITYMIGDADGFPDDTFGPFPEDGKAFMDFLDMIESITDDRIRLDSEHYIEEGYPTVNCYWHSMRDCNIPDEMFDIPAEKQDYITDDLIEEIDFEPEYEPYSCDYVLPIDSLDYYYVDKDGNKFDVDYVEVKERKKKK